MTEREVSPPKLDPLRLGVIMGEILRWTMGREIEPSLGIDLIICIFCRLGLSEEVATDLAVGLIKTIK